jgi:hypothetical protein
MCKGVKFQRHRTWNHEQENQLIDTMKNNNLSIGALELYHIGNKNNKECYLLVDGLHRATTLTKFCMNLFDFKFTKSLINNIKNEINDKYKKSYDKENINNLCNKWFNYSILGSFNDFVVEKLFNEKHKELEKIIKSICDDKDVESISNMIMIKTRELAKHIDISKTFIPVILNVGGIDVLPLLFERINKGGTPLTGCDILAARWYNCNKIDIHNKEIIEHIKLHYDDLQEENNGMELFYDKKEKLYTIYEYVIGLDRYLCDKYDNTFLHHISDKEFIFKLLACCLIGNITKKSIDQLKDKILEIDDLSEFENTLEYSINFVSNAIDDIILIGTKTLVKEIPFFISLIALTYKNKNKIEKNESFYKNTYQLNLLNDKLSEVNFSTSIIRTIVNDKKYMSKVDKNEFIEKFKRFFTNSNKSIGKQDRMSNTSLLILNYITTFKCNDDDTEFEIGYIIPKKVLLSFNKVEKSILSINCIGNLCLYPSGEHKRGLKESINTYLSDQDISDTDASTKYLYLNNSIDYDDIIDRHELTNKYYNEFLKFRCSNMMNILLDIYSKYLKDISDDKYIEISEDESNSDSDSNSNSDYDNDSDSDNTVILQVKNTGNRKVITKK